MSSGKMTFHHLNGKVKWHNIQIWDTNNPHIIANHVRDSPKITMFHTKSRRELQGSFFFAKKTITRCVYLDIPTWLKPQVEQDMPNVDFKQDISSWMFEHILMFSAHWISRAVEEKRNFFLLPPRNSLLVWLF